MRLVALLRIPGAALGHLADALGEKMTALDDATLLATDVRTVDAAAISRALRERIGDGLALHRDPRGVLVFPDSMAPGGATYATLVGELDQTGTWVQLVDEPAPSPLEIHDTEPSVPAVAPANPRERRVTGLGGELRRAEREAADLEASLDAVERRMNEGPTEPDPDEG